MVVGTINLEYLLYHSRPEQRKNRSERTIARNKAEAEGRVRKGDGKDLDHVVPLSKGGSYSESNTRVVAAGTNRSFQRNPDGSLKNQRSKRERRRG